MRHKSVNASFGRRTDARKALLRGLVSSLVEHGRIKTTVAKAKELRRHAERAVTLGKKGDLSSRRILLSRYPNKFTVETIMSDLAPRFKERNGGYTRIIKLGNRPGDKAEMAYIEWVDYQIPSVVETPSSENSKEASPAKKAVAKKKTAKKAKKTATTKSKKAKAKA